MRTLRRSIIAPLMVLSITSAPAIAADPTPAALLAAASEVSPAMQSLIHDFVMASIRRDALEASEDTEALGLAIQERHRVLVALAFRPPTNGLELASKLSVITEYSEDTERWSIRAVAEDAARLAGEVAR